MSAFLFSPDPDGAMLTDEQVVDEVIGLLMAGVDTPAVTLSWIFHELSGHPDVERRVREEVDAVVGDGPVTAEHVRSLDYVQQVIQETLRRYGAYLLVSQADATSTWRAPTYRPEAPSPSACTRCTTTTDRSPTRTGSTRTAGRPSGWSRSNEVGTSPSPPANESAPVISSR